MEIVTNLDEAAYEFFPQTGEWLTNCLTVPRSKQSFKRDFLPAHLEDEQWLAESFRLFCKQNKFFKKLPSKEFFADYCTGYNAPSRFHHLLHEYKMKVVHWQIDWMLAGGGNWVYDPNELDNLEKMKYNQVETFKKGVIDTLTALGLNLKTIREGLATYDLVDPDNRVDWKEMMWWKEYKFLKAKGETEASFKDYKAGREKEYYADNSLEKKCRDDFVLRKNNNSLTHFYTFTGFDPKIFSKD